MFTDTRTIDYQVGTLQIDRDAADGKLVWRGSAEQVLRSRQARPTSALAACASWWRGCCRNTHRTEPSA